MDIQTIIHNLAQTYVESTPSFSIDVYNDNIEKAMGCKLRPRSPYIATRGAALLETGERNDTSTRTKAVEGYCREFLETLQKTYPDQAERFAKKLSGVQIKMGKHKTTFAEVRRAIKEKYEEMRLKANGEAVFMEQEQTTTNRSLETKYENELSRQTVSSMRRRGAAGLSYSKEGIVQVLGGKDKHSLYHELIHQMTTRRKSNCQLTVGYEVYARDEWGLEYENFGNALNEGMTEKTEWDLFRPNRKRNFTTAYIEFTVPCDILELCVGTEAMRKAFFECDVFQIFDALKIEGKNKEDFIKFIRSLDFLYDNYEESDKMESERKQKLLSQKERIETYYQGQENTPENQRKKQEELKEIEDKLNIPFHERRKVKMQVFHDVGNYLTILFTETLKTELREAQEQGYTEEQLRALAQSQQQRVQQFYQLINTKFGKYKYATDETLTILREGIKSMSQSKSR